jgi:hypothetical protein
MVMIIKRSLISFGDAAPTPGRLSKRTVILLAMAVSPLVGIFLADSFLRYQARRIQVRQLPGDLLAMALVEAVSALQAATPESELLPVE